MKKIVFLIICIGILAITINAAEVIYVQSDKAKVMNQPRFDSQVVWYAKKGDKLWVQVMKKDWIMVSDGSRKGWINSLLVSNDPPNKNITIIGITDTDLTKNARRRVSSFTSAAAARGLKVTRKETPGIYFPNYRSLNQLIIFSSKISQKEIDEFISSGGLK